MNEALQQMPQQALQRIDLEIIADLVEKGSRVLDVGCANGDLLVLMKEKRQVRGCGIELSQAGVNACVARGLNVIQGDAETDLDDYPDGAFDYVILSQTIQAMHAPANVLKNMLRIGRYAIISLPNFGFWRVRLYLLFHGQMPVSRLLPDQWHDTPNIRLCTIKDFVSLCREMKLTIGTFLALSSDNIRPRLKLGSAANWLAAQAIFVLKKGEQK